MNRSSGIFHTFICFLILRGLPLAQLVKNSPAKQETWVPSLGWEDPLEEILAAHPSILAIENLLQSFPASGFFSNKSALYIRVQSIKSFSFSNSPSNEYSELISFRIDWFDLLAVQGTLESLLQHYSSKASILWRSAFFMVQLSHPYTTTGKTTALTRQTFVGKVTSLLFNMLSRFIIAFLPRSKHPLIPWLQSSSAMILVPKKIKSVPASILSSSICHELMGLDAMILVFWMLSFMPAFSLSSFTSLRGS